MFLQSWYLGELNSIPSVERDSDSANKCPELQHKHHWWAPPAGRIKQLKGTWNRTPGAPGPRTNQQAALIQSTWTFAPPSKGHWLRAVEWVGSKRSLLIWASPHQSVSHCVKRARNWDTVIHTIQTLDALLYMHDMLVSRSVSLVLTSPLLVLVYEIM